VNAVSLDADSNILMTGYFNGTRDFDLGPLTDNHVSNGNDDAFAWKLMPDGYY
jgi:hypothetical protein